MLFVGRGKVFRQTIVDLKRFSGHTSLRSLERYIADNREAAKRKARAWERRQG
jgi:hypothetical protein